MWGSLIRKFLLRSLIVGGKCNQILLLFSLCLSGDHTVVRTRSFLFPLFECYKVLITLHSSEETDISSLLFKRLGRDKSFSQSITEFSGTEERAKGKTIKPFSVWVLPSSLAQPYPFLKCWGLDTFQDAFSAPLMAVPNLLPLEGEGGCFSWHVPPLSWFIVIPYARKRRLDYISGTHFTHNLANLYL